MALNGETVALLAEQEQQRGLPAHAMDSASKLQIIQQSGPYEVDATVSSYAVLPVGFLAALGMAVTAATEIYAYAFLLCQDPKHCQDSERNRYSGVVAMAVCITNICNVLALGFLTKLVKKRPKAGLALWIVLRSMSVVMLAFGGNEPRFYMFLLRVNFQSSIHRRGSCSSKWSIFRRPCFG